MQDALSTFINGTQSDWIELKKVGFNIIVVSWRGRQNMTFFAPCQNQRNIRQFHVFISKIQAACLESWVNWSQYFCKKTFDRDMTGIYGESWWFTQSSRRSQILQLPYERFPTPQLYEVVSWDRCLVRKRAQRGINQHSKSYLKCYCTSTSSDLRKMTPIWRGFRSQNVY
jgi:hypothetical protein